MTLGESAAAAEPTAARDSFDRGLVLFEQGDAAGALAEFERSYAMSHHPAVLYEICRAHVALNEPVEAVRSLERLLASAELEGPRREQAARWLAEQTAKTGTLRIASNAAVARITLDGVDVGTLDEAERGVHPQTALVVSVGSHVLGLSAPGYLPARLTVNVTSREEKAQLVSLEPSPAGAGQIALQVTPVDTAVWLDGELLGKTPQVALVAVAPGAHRIELRRPGYVTVSREVQVVAQSSLALEAQLTPEPTATSGRLEVAVSEADAQLTLDGAPLLGADGVPVPVGEHLLTVARSGFVTTRRVIQVTAQGSKVSVTLAPTADYRAAYVERARRQGFWGWTATLAGTALTGAGAGYLIWSENQQAQDTTLGWVLGGAGLASLGTGVCLLLSQDDPERYEPKARSDVFGRLSLSPRTFAQGAGLQLGGTF